MVVQQVRIDILGPFPTITQQIKFLVMIVDYFTKWIEPQPMAIISAGQVCKFLYFGVPKVIIT
ncbi:hypothetical protein CR513_16446, partial [Mucuna pruriens]